MWTLWVKDTKDIQQTCVNETEEHISNDLIESKNSAPIFCSTNKIFEISIPGQVGWGVHLLPDKLTLWAVTLMRPGNKAKLLSNAIKTAKEWTTQLGAYRVKEWLQSFDSATV